MNFQLQNIILNEPSSQIIISNEFSRQNIILNDTLPQKQSGSPGQQRPLYSKVFTLIGKIKLINLHLCFDWKNPAIRFEFLLLQEN